MTIHTHLISGAGNTFHIAYSNKWNHPSGHPSIAKTICEKNKADGFIFLEKVPDEKNIVKKYKWYFFNNDGSDAEMCGNATRCVGFYIKNILKSEQKSWFLKTTAGLIRIDFISAEKYKITMTPPQVLKSEAGFYCDTGVPHLVIENDHIVTDEKLMRAARELRQSAQFRPRGTNITYVVLDSAVNRIKAVSYERGVEDFTSACGTGAMAAALYNLASIFLYPSFF
jgi:diaminopimelate epimerase